MWILLFLTVSFLSSFRCSPLVYSERHVRDLVLNSESATYKELQRNADHGIKGPSSSVGTDNPSGISSTLTQASIKNGISKTSISLKNRTGNKQYQIEKVLRKGVTDLNTNHRDLNDSKIFMNIVTTNVQNDDHLKNASHPQKNDNKIKSLNENSKSMKHHAESESSVTTKQVDLRYREGSNNETNIHNASADDRIHDHDKETTKQKGRMTRANSTPTHLNETRSANKNTDSRTTTLLELPGQRYADKNINMLKMLEEKEVLNIPSLTSSNVKKSIVEHEFSKTTSMSPLKSKLVAVTEEANLKYREGSNSHNRTTNIHSESVGDKKHDHDEGTNKKVEGTTKANSNGSHLNTSSVNQITDPRTTVMEQSGQRHADKNLNTLKMLKEKVVLNATSSSDSKVKNSIVTEEVNLKYREGSNSYNRTTNIHSESVGDKKHDHNEGTNKKIEGTTKANSNGFHLNTSSVNQITDPRTTVMEQSGQRHADKNLNTLKMLEEKEVLNATSSSDSKVKNSIVTEKVKLSYKEGLNSDNRTTNNHNESADDKRHEHDEKVTKQGVTIKENSDGTHLSDARSANQTTDSKATLIVQSGQRHANKSANIVKMLEKKEVLNVTALTRSNAQNSSVEPKISKTTTVKPLLKKVIVFVYKTKNEKVNRKTPFIPPIF